MTSQLISIKLKWSSLIKKIFQLLQNNLGAALSWLGSGLLEMSLDSQNVHQKRAKHSALKDPLRHEQIQTHVFDLRARLVFIVSDPKEKTYFIILILAPSLITYNYREFFLFSISVFSLYTMCFACAHAKPWSHECKHTFVYLIWNFLFHLCWKSWHLSI